MDEKKYMMHKCQHCGNMGLMRIESDYSQASNKAEYLTDGRGKQTPVDTKADWILLSCLVCYEPTLIKMRMDDSTRQLRETAVLYPQGNGDFKYVPKNIKAAYTAARDIRNISDAECLVGIRRTVELICTNKGATKGTLDSKIEVLKDKGVIPATFNDALWVMRQLGNDATHNVVKDFDPEFIDEALDFLQELINNIYYVPNRAKSIKNEIETRRLEREKIANEKSNNRQRKKATLALTAEKTGDLSVKKDRPIKL